MTWTFILFKGRLRVAYVSHCTTFAIEYPGNR